MKAISLTCRFTAALAALVPAAACLAQQTAFLSTFAASRVNPAVYAEPGLSDADYVVGSTKSHGLGSIGPGGLSLDLANTSAAFVEAAARVIKVPIHLSEAGDVITLIVSFSAQSGILQGATNSQLGFGLYASGGSNPPPGVAGQVRFDFADYTSGYIQDWKGYCLLFENAGGANRLYLRPAQAAGANNAAQELLFPTNTGAFANAVSLQAGSFAGATLANGTLCTAVFTLTLVNPTTLSLQGSLYEGPAGTGILLASVSGSAAGVNLQTTRFDAVGLGYNRKNVTGNSSIVYHSLEIRSNKPTTPARILAGPDDLTLPLGGSGSISVTVDGAEPITYAWYRDDALLPAETTGSIVFTDAGSAIEGAYHVVVTNDYGSDTSPSALVTVTTQAIKPAITSQPEGATRLVGESHTLTVGVSGTAPFSYDWRKDGVSLGAEDAKTLVLDNLTLADAGAYTVIVTNSAGSAESEAALLEVWSPPSITAGPEPVMATPGQQVVLTVAADGHPAPSFKWYRNGVLLAGETAPTLTIPSVSLADVGVYRADAVNAAGVDRGAGVTVNVLSTLALSAAFPDAPSVGLPPDIQIALQFDRPVKAGNAGTIAVYQSNGTLVDTIDMAAESRAKTVGGLVYQYDPVLTDGANAWIVPHTGVLQYGKSYYMLLGAGVVQDLDGGSFAGVLNPGTITFAIRDTAPAAGAPVIRVAAGGAADFATVQGAIDHVPAGNTSPVTIRIAPGTYRELLHIPSSKPRITLQGSSRDQVTVTYLNNANRNLSNQRASFYSKASDLVIDSITFVNTTPKGGSQAETLNTEGNRVVVRDCAFISLQDTLKLSTGGVYFYRCTIVGDTDFLWGDARAFLEECVIHSVNRGYVVQVRNGQAGHGFVFVRCRLTGEPAAAGSYLGRIDPNVYPYSEAVFIDCAMGEHISPSGWLLNNASSAPHVRFYEFGSTDLNGAPLDLGGRLADATILDPASADLFRDPLWVTGFNPVPVAWAAGLRGRDASGWAYDSSLGWNWGYPYASGNAGSSPWCFSLNGWVYAWPTSPDTVFLYAYNEPSAGWYWSNRGGGIWVWSDSAAGWTKRVN